MKKKTRAFLGAFLVTSVVIGGLIGFMAVDLTTDRYMPGQFAPFFLLGEVDERGIELSWMGESYRLDAYGVMRVQAAVWDYRGLLPVQARLTAGLAVRLMELCEELAAS